MEEIYIGESDIDENGEKTPRVGVGLQEEQVAQEEQEV